MRKVRDGSGHEWECAEILRHGIGDRPAPVDTALLRARSGERVLDFEMLPGELMRVSDIELGQTIDMADAWWNAEQHGRSIRSFADREGTRWVADEQGLPGETRAKKGGICLRFISVKETRYLCPVPAWWVHEADASLENYLNRAKPVSNTE
jgi:hypothetical protein